MYDYRKLTEEHKKKISIANSGKNHPFYGENHTEETKKRISIGVNKALSEGKMRYWKNKKRPDVSGKNHHLYGKHRTEDTRKKISDSKKGWKMSESQRMSISKRMSGKNHPMWGKHPSEKSIKKMSISHMGNNPSKETRIKLSKSTTKLWKTREFVKKVHKSAQIKPNGSELKLLSMLNTNFPDEWKYVGDFSCNIDGKNPDFININGQRKIIELFGNWWHSERKTGMNEHEHEFSRIKHFRKNGYDLLVVWERELDNEETLLNKLFEFNEQEGLRCRI